MNNLKTTEEKEAYFYENILPIIGNIDHRHAWATTPHFDLAMTMLNIKTIDQLEKLVGVLKGE